MSTTGLGVKTPCNLCHADDFTILFPASVAQVNQIVRCNRCGLMYANPRKEADHVEIQSWPDDPNFDFEKEHPQRFEKERLQVRDFDRSRALLNRLHPSRGKIVEVGSSLGFLLAAMRQDGWSVLGVEPDRNASRYAIAKQRIETINSTLEAARLPDEFADAVVMLHVIEHVPDPVGTLREIRRILKPGGHLILETPRYDTLMFRLLGSRERSLSCDGHIFFFTTDTLRTAYTAAGLELERLEYTGRSLTLDRLAYNVGVISKSRAVQRAVSSLSRRTAMHRIRFTVNVRDIQRVCLTRPFAGARPDGERLSTERAPST
jgi:2-polyprenyl-3-methyl-5-hydroxy-6-metoxy-1,4-benzoquinol methylase